MNTAIQQALFALESVAHLQGKEAELLPIIAAARNELAAVERPYKEARVKYLGRLDRAMDPEEWEEYKALIREGY